MTVVDDTHGLTVLDADDYRYVFCDICGDEIKEGNRIFLGPEGSVGYQMRRWFFPEDNKPVVESMDICSNCTEVLLKKNKRAMVKMQGNLEKARERRKEKHIHVVKGDMR